jgi:hypothetical protein
MTDPYRGATAPPCLRCGLPLVEDDDKDLVCPDGCGRWISTMTLVKLVGTTDLAKLARPVAHWKATPFPASTCPACEAKLVEQYMPMPDGAILTHGYCTRHGAWLDQGTHADFLAAYARAIVDFTGKAKLRAEAPQAAEHLESLEERVERLERQVAELREFVGRRRWLDWKE